MITSIVYPMEKYVEQETFTFRFKLFDIQLRDRDREQLKESFASINSAIDNLRQQCQEYIVSDVGLRDRLRNEGKKLILEMYKTYYTKFANKDFTRHREKYIRYDPTVLELTIDNFFEHRL